MYDILIKNGKVIDGSGTPWFYGDIAVSGGKIVKISRPIRETAWRIIDVRGNIVCPGFIDIHSHSDLALLVNPLAESKVRQGVTLEVGGNCGHSPAPVTNRWEEDLKRELKINYGLKLQWRGFGEFLDIIQTRGISVNYASLVGHEAVRKCVLGYRNTRPSAEDLHKMGDMVSNAMKQGAFGISTGLIYPPGSYADTDEIVFLAGIAGNCGGYYATHMRDEGDHLLEAVKEAVLIGERAGIPVQISHHKAVGKPNWGKVKDSLALMEEARERGIDVTCDQYPYTAASTNLSSIIPDRFHDGGSGELIRKLKDPQIRKELKKEITREQLNKGGWAVIFISSVGCSKNKWLEGKNLEEIGKALSKDPCDAALDLIIEEKDRVEMIRFGMDEGDVRCVMKHRLTMIGSDGSARANYGVLGTGKPHPRSYGTFARVLGRYVREEKVLTLEEAVKKMTGLPAWRLGIKDRGLLKEGNWADITVFDPGKIEDTATYFEPHRYARGILYVIVNGRLVIDEGEHTGELSGMVLRKNQKRVQII